jgi:DNA replication protein DnaC
MSTPPDTQPAGKSKKKILLIGIITLSVIAATCLGLLGEVMPEGIQKQLKSYFDQKQNIWITFVVLLAVIGILAAYWLTDKVDKAEPEPAELTDDERQRFIKLLQNRYARRLQQKTGERFALKLELRYTLNGVQQIERLDMAARQPGQPNAELAELINKHRNLLLMGQPGAGKTTLLLGTASTLLQEAANDATKPLPVIFNLASWKNTEPSFAEWMANILVQGYSYPSKRAAHAVQEGNLLLLLDGLDEVGNYIEDEAQRNAERKLCLAAIQAYLNQRKSPAGMIICTRTSEYLAGGGDAPVHAQLLIEPLDKTELQDCLQKISQGEGQPAFENPNYREANRNAAVNLLQLTANSPNLADLLCTPFYFNAALQVLHKPGDGSISFVHDAELTRQKLETLYINRTLSNSQSKAYPPEKIRHWLSWLAHWQQRRSSTSFELSSFGVGSLQLTPKQLKRYGLVVILIGGLIIGLITSLVFGSVGSLSESMAMGLIVGFCGGLFLVDFDKIKLEAEIATYDITRLSSKTITSRKFLKKIVESIFVSFIIGLISVFIDGWITSIRFALLLGLIFGLVRSFFEGLFSVSFTEITHPTQRIYTGFHFVSLLFIASLLALYALTLWGALADPKAKLQSSFALGLALLVVFRSRPLMMFTAVQLTLSRLGHLPLRMARFFDYCANELHLLEKDTGGSWRFRHQIIQDYFLQEYRNTHPADDEAT